MGEVQFSAADRPLQREVHELGRWLGQIIVEREGRAFLVLEEAIRRECKHLRAGGAAAAQARRRAALLARLARLTPAQTTAIARAFTLYFHLTNLAEQRHRVRRKREHEARGQAQSGSLAATIAALRRAGVSPARLGRALDALSLELVLTAHPTQALRRTVLHRLEEISRRLERLERGQPTPPEKQQLEEQILEQIEALWLTDQVRSERLSVLDEARGTLAYFEDVFFAAIPQLRRRLIAALAPHYPRLAARVWALDGPSAPVRFGSWIGGDADGNPYVTPDVVRRALGLHRHVAAEFYRRQVEALFFELGHPRRALPGPGFAALEARLAAYRETFGPPPPRFAAEPARELLNYARLRLIAGLPVEPAPTAAGGGAGNATAAAPTGGGNPQGPGASVPGAGAGWAGEPHAAAPAYASADEFAADLQALRAALARPAPRAARRVEDLLAALRTFGLHLATLDLRENSAAQDAALAAFAFPAYADWDEAARLRALRQLLEDPHPPAAENGRPALLGRLAAAAAGRRHVREAAQYYVISMTREASDIWAALALQAAAGMARLRRDASGAPRLEAELHPVPLFETIADLERAPEVLASLFADPAYAAYLRQRGGRQLVMIGYSDSNKDGGYVAAHWLLYQAQRRMTRAAQAAGVEVEFFHGRGGTVARGGGRAYEALLALPPGTVRGRVRVTEQGEVISAKYADPEIAGRNLELAFSGLLLATLGLQPAQTPAGALRPMRPSTTGPAVLARLSADSLAAYRQLLTPGLLAYFWRATPVAELGQLNLGSRPSFRARQPDFHNLRAIPWVFAWTQNRALLPAWYGLGTALVAELARPGGRRRLQLLYRQWGFFRDLMDNAEMALAKTDLPITRAYQSLAPDPAAAERMAADWEQEFARAVRGVLAITGEKDLLDRSPVLARSIRLRNPYVDPLSLLQVGLLARQRQAAAGGGTGNEGAERGGPAGGQESAWDAGSEQALLLTLQGIAAGMRNTG